MPVDTPHILADHRRSPLLDDLFVVDFDVHINERPGRSRPRSASSPGGKHSRRSKRSRTGTSISRHSRRASRPWVGAALPTIERRTTVTDPVQLRDDLDLLGVDVGVLFPDSFLLHALIKPPDYAVALARAYNRWLVDRWLGEDRGFKGALLAPNQDPRAAAEEIRLYAGHPHIGCVYLPILLRRSRSTATASYDPMFEAAQECGLPVVLHSVTAINPVFPFNLQEFETLFCGAFARAHDLDGRRTRSACSRPASRFASPSSRSPSPRAASPGFRGSRCASTRSTASDGATCRS